MDELLCDSSSKVQTHQYSLSIGQISNNFADRLGQFTHEGRDSQYLVPAGQSRVFEEVHDLDVISSSEVFFAETFEIGECGQGLGRLAGDIEPQLKSLGGVFSFGFCGVFCGGSHLPFPAPGRPLLLLASVGPKVLSAMRLRAMAARSVTTACARRPSSWDSLVELFEFGFQAGLENFDLRLAGAPFALHVAFEACHRLLADERFRFVARFLGESSGAGQHFAATGIDVQQLNASIRKAKLRT